MIDSQDKMLKRLNKPSAPRDAIIKSFKVHLDRLFEWLPKQRHFRVHEVSYNDILANPEAEVLRVAEFLDGAVSPEAMLQAIDASLYRNRRQ
jgi:hypothetical protein